MGDLSYILKSIARAHIVTAMTMIALIALSFMVVGNAIPVVFSTLDSLYSTSGVEESNLGVLHIQNAATDTQTVSPLEVIAHLNAVPGVKASAAISSLPLQNEALTFNPMRQRGENAVPRGTTAYIGSPGFLSVLGVRLFEGRTFASDEYASTEGMLPQAKVTIITQDLANYLWPNSEALGKLLIASDENTYQVIGVVGRVAETSPTSLAKSQFVAFFPAAAGKNLSETYIFRYNSSFNVASSFDKIALQIHQLYPFAAYARPTSFEQLRSDYFAKSVKTAWMLAVICLVVVLTMSMGIGGLTSHWFAQRRRSVAIKRSLGASRGDIVRYFLVENLTLTFIGVVIGAVAAALANQWLLRHFEMQQTDYLSLAYGCVVFVLINLASIAAPLRKSVTTEPSQVFRN